MYEDGGRKLACRWPMNPARRMFFAHMGAMTLEVERSIPVPTLKKFKLRVIK